MTTQIQQEAIQLVLDVISFLIPLSIAIAVSSVFVSFFKKFIRGN